MIIAEGFRRLFNGLTIEYGGVDRNVNYHQGDQKELVKWILAKGNQEKYPLIWYVTSPYTEFNGWYEAKSKLIIMQSTRIDWLNNKRATESYTKLIEPVWQGAKALILKSNSIVVFSKGSLKDRFLLSDQPSYGVDINDTNGKDSDFKSLQKVRDKSASIDFVDARIIEFHFKMKANCI